MFLRGSWDATWPGRGEKESCLYVCLLVSLGRGWLVVFAFCVSARRERGRAAHPPDAESVGDKLEAGVVGLTIVHSGLEFCCSSVCCVYTYIYIYICIERDI